MKRIRILLGDDHSLILDGLRARLQAEFEIVGTSTDGKALIEAACSTKPDIVVADITMPVVNGIDASRQIKLRLPRIKVVIISMHTNGIYIRKALEAGASAYVLKSGASEELMLAIETVMRGEYYFSPNLRENLIESLSGPSTGSSRAIRELTGRQKQVLQLVAEGRHNKEIAEILGVSVRTVEFHRERLMVKLGAKSAADLSRYAIQEGLVSPI